ncbi:MAG: hypothetical protein QJR02_09315 [Sinobacteraceae bacterium]|nr:hypothetical protein [Nevskiaceae bacterium]
MKRKGRNPMEAGERFILRTTLIALALAGTVAQGAETVGPETADEAARTGIWKAVVPPVPMHGEFDNNDPIGLIAGQLIPTDCSINWIDPDDHKRYCFASATSLVYFEEWPQANIERARQNWQALRSTTP